MAYKQILKLWFQLLDIVTWITLNNNISEVFLQPQIVVVYICLNLSKLKIKSADKHERLNFSLF